VRGSAFASGGRMTGVKRFEDLVCWQRANALKLQVYELIDESRAINDFKFRDQLRASASSVTANLSEAFGSYKHSEAAKFVRYAKASLTETHNHLLDGVHRKYWSTERVAPLLVLSERAMKAVVGWLKYLARTDEPPAYWEEEHE
jgi:four helix bundle protein